MILYLILASDPSLDTTQKAETTAVIANDFETGKQAFMAGKHQEACVSFEGWLKHHPDVTEAKAYLGAVYDELSRHEEAQKILEAAIQAYKETQPDNKAGLAFALMHLGKTLSQQGQYEKSASALKESIELYRVCGGSEKAHLTRANTLMAETYMYGGFYKEAEPYFKAVIASYETGDPQILWTELRLARLYMFMGNYEGAKSIFERGVACLRSGTDKDKLGWNLFYLGDVYRSLKQFEDAERVMKEGLEAFRDCRYGEDHQITQWGQGYYGRLLCDRGQHAQAQPILEQSLRVHEKTYGKNNKRNGFIMQALANAYAHLKFFKEADLLFCDTLAVYEKQFGTQHTEYALVLRDYGLFARLQGSETVAQERLIRASSILEQAGHKAF